MADSLLDTVKTGNTLLQGSQAEVGRLAGGPTSPSPLEAAVTGASPDQAKMAATPNTVQAAVKGSQDLATTLRRQQAYTGTSAAQQQAQQTAQELQGLNSLNQRVPALINQAITQGTQAAGTVTTMAPDTTHIAGLGLSAENQAKLTGALTVLGNASASQADKDQAEVDANNAMGITDPAKQLSADLLQHQFMSPGAQLSEKLAGATPSTVTMGMLQPSDLGVSSWDQLGADLGLPAGAVEKMSVKQLSDAVTVMKQKGYQSADQWRSVLGDPTSSTQERETARMMLTNMGASGVKETEARVASLNTQVAAANQVTFMGKSMTVDDALKSDTIKGLVASYLGDPENGIVADPAIKAQIQQTEPAMAKWIDANANALAGLVKGVSDETVRFAKIQVDNAAVLDVQGAGLPADQKAALGKALFGDSWGTITAQTYTAPPLLQSLKDPTTDPKLAASTLNTLGHLSTLGPMGATQVQSMAGVTANEIVAAANSVKNPDGTVGMPADQYMAKITTYVDMAYTAANLKPGDDPSTVMAKYFPGQSTSQVTNELSGISAADNLLGVSGAASMGAGNKGAMVGADGNPLPTDSLVSNLNKMFGGVKLGAIIKSGNTPPSPSDMVASGIKAIQAYEKKETEAGLPVMASVAKLLETKGKITSDDITSLSAGAGDYKNLDALQAVANKLPGEAKNIVYNAIEQRAKDDVGKQMKSIGSGPSNIDQALAAADAGQIPIEWLQNLQHSTRDADPRVQSLVQVINTKMQNSAATKARADQAAAAQKIKDYQASLAAERSARGLS